MSRSLRVELNERDMGQSPHRAVAAAIIRALGRDARIDLDPVDVVVRIEDGADVTVKWRFPTPDPVAKHLYYEDGHGDRAYSFDVPVPDSMSAFLPAPEASRGD